MTPDIASLPACSACGGPTVPLILCDTCGAASMLRDPRKIDWAAACPECGTFNPWQLICEQCHSRFPAPGRAAEPVERIAAGVPPEPAAPLPASRPPRQRPLRHLKSESDPRALQEIFRPLGIDDARARALIERGYNTIWKVARSTEAELARIPEVGPVAARKIAASLHLLNYKPPQTTKELILRDEYECPLCRCITSAFAHSCLECGTPFDEEEMDESIRDEFERDGLEGLLAFYEGRVAEDPGNADLWYARGLLLETMGRPEEAAKSLGEAAKRAPDARKVKVALLRVQARRPDPEVAEQLRDTARALVDEAAWEAEVAELDQLISQVGPTCERCGAALSEDATKCEQCGTPVGAAEAPASPPKPAGVAELDLLVDDLLVGELEESLTPEELERTKAAVLDWLIVELEETLGAEAKGAKEPERAEAEAKVAKPEPPEQPSPAEKSVGFLSGWMKGSKGLVSRVGARRRQRGTVGKVNGLVNGQGRVNGKVNGLVNGRGQVNGLVNGVGRVNGMGAGRGRRLVNGLVGPPGRVNGMPIVTPAQTRIRLSQSSRRVRYGFIFGGVLVAIIIAAGLFVPTPGPFSPIQIDGVFEDWASVPMFDSATPAADPNVSLARYAVLPDRDALYLHAATMGETFGDPTGYDGIYFFIDTDGDPTTGFSFAGLGAEAVVGVLGSNQTAESARLFVFPADAELNWSRRQSAGFVSAAATAAGLEVKVSTFDLARFDANAFRVAVYADNFRGSSSQGVAPLNPRSGAILLTLIPRTTILGPGWTPLLDVRVQALGIRAGDAWTISGFQFNLTAGLAASLSAESVTLTQGRPVETISVSVSAPGFFSGDVVEVDIADAIAPRSVTVRGGPVRAYVLSPPASVRIDGLFLDWFALDVLDTDPSPVGNPHVDIVRMGATANSSAAFFHVTVAGSMLEGKVPERPVRTRPGPGGNGTPGPPVPLPRQTGEDIFQVYVDLDSTDPAGLSFAGILADYLLEVRGHSGRITSRTLYAWSGGWMKIPSPDVALAKGVAEIEGSIGIGPTSNRTRIVFASTDWSGIGDITEPVNVTAQLPPPSPVSDARQVNAPEFQEILAPLVVTLLIVLVMRRRRRVT